MKKKGTVYTKKQHKKAGSKRDYTVLNSLLLIVIACLSVLLALDNLHFSRPVPPATLAAALHPISLTPSPKQPPKHRPKPTPTLTPTPTATSSSSFAFGIPKAQAADTDFCLYVPMILYHHIQPMAEATELGHAQLTVDSTYFDSQMAYLANHGYHTVSVDEITTALLTHQQLPAKTIAVTIDDGYDDAYNYAFPILKKYNLVGNFMIPAGLIGTSGYMTWDQLKEMKSQGQMFFYNHTWSHSPLGLDTPQVISDEMSKSMKALSDELGIKQTTIIYPYGSYSQAAIDQLRQLGFSAGVSTDYGNEQCDSYIMTLHRVHIGNAPMSEYGF